MDYNVVINKGIKHALFPRFWRKLEDLICRDMLTDNRYFPDKESRAYPDAEASNIGL